MRENPIVLGKPDQRLLRHVLVAVSLASASLTFSSCGKVGPPVPPVRLSERITQLTAVQRGSGIVLDWPPPPLNVKENNVQYVNQAYIYRLKEQEDQEPTLDPEDFADQAEKIAFLNHDDIAKQTNELGTLEFVDKLRIAGPADVTNVRLRYAVRYINKRGQEGPFSNTVAIQPIAAVASFPPDLRLSGEAQDKVFLEWKTPSSDIDGKTPADVVGYNVYRRLVKDPKSRVLLNQRPVIETTFTDTRFQYLSRYEYTVRTLSTGDRGLIESIDSPALDITPVDRFAPSAPTPVSVASVNGIVSLFWPTNPEKDVVGYYIYRAEKADAPPANWVKLTPKPVTLVTFRDDKVKPGERYYYRVTAIDRFDNESEPSATVSQIANP